MGPSGGLNVDTSIFEFVTLTFDQLVQFTDYAFRDDDHGLITEGVIGLSLDDPTSNDMVFVLVDIADLGDVIADHDFYSSNWSFASLNPWICNPSDDGIVTFVADDYNCVNFYIDGVTATSQIPIPAAGWLLLAGVGGLAAMRRRKS